MVSKAADLTALERAGEYRMLIGGELETSSQWLDVLNPATGEKFVSVPRASPAQLEKAVAAANDAFKSWSLTTIEQRRAKLVQLADRIKENCARIAPVLTGEQGKPLVAAAQEIQAAEAFCRHFASLDLPVEIITESATQRVEMHRRPLGVVAAIAPWNFPFLIAVYKLAPALIAGNTVILKPAPTTPVTTLLLGELACDLFPPGVVNTLVDNNDLGPILSAHPGVAKISFTGSTGTGRKVMAGAASTLKRLTLELGGNDAAIVLDDIDPKEVAPQIFGAAFLNSGQVCIAIKRVYAHKKIYDELCAELGQLARNTVVGDGMDPRSEFGPVQNRAQYEKVVGLISSARSAGGRVVAGEAPQGGYCVPLTIVCDIEDGVALVDEEQFGPVLPIVRVEDAGEAIRRANNSSYGLGASVWSRDLQMAQNIAGRLHTGTVWINQHCAFGPHIPMPGRKDSGIGVEWGREGMLEYTAMQIVNIKTA